MKIFLIVINIFVGSSGFAQSLFVRTGEHEDFTRVAVEIPGSVSPVVERTVSGVRVLFRGHPGELDVSDAFRRISTNIFSKIQSTGNSLDLTFDCKCGFSTSMSTESVFVLDVARGSGESQSSKKRDELTSGTRESFFYEPAEEIRSETQKHQSVSGEIFSPSIPLFADRQDLSDVSFELEPRRFGNVSNTTAEHLNLESLSRDLVKSIGAAATRGLLEPESEARHMTSSFDSPLSVASVNVPVSRSDLDGESKNDVNMVNLMQTSASVEAMAGNSLESSSLLELWNCDSTQEFAVQNWGVEGHFALQIANFRRSLFGEFDKIDLNVQRELAKSYLYFGFGAEALQVLDLSYSDEKYVSALRILAGILDEIDVSGSSGLSSLAECNSDIALWAILSTPIEKFSSPVNGDAAIRALEKLPLHLKRHLAPRLGRKLRLLGDLTRASHALRSISRSGSVLPSSAVLENSELLVSTDRSDSAAESLAELATSNELEAPLALVRFIDLQVERGEEISADTAILAEAYASEHRHTDLGPRVKRAHILALAKSGQIGGAFQALEVAREIDLDVNEILNELFNVLHSDAKNSDFLRYVLSLREADLDVMSDWTQFKLASRLLSLGFVSEADGIISQIPSDFNPREMSRIKGRAALSLGDFTGVLSFTEGFEGEEFARLKAQAYSALGRFDDAAELYSSLGEVDAERISIWRSGKKKIGQNESDVFSLVDNIQEWPDLSASASALSELSELVTSSSQFVSSVASVLDDPALAVSE